ncbi:MAG: hypothetical protein ACREDR_15395, partial [Blastocatellia bacterium]
MKSALTVLALVLVLSGSGLAQKATLSPTETVLSFYRNLKEKKYAEGFRLSVYRAAIEGLSDAEMKEFEPDFAQTFAKIPDQIESQGELVKGDTATVLLKFPGGDKPQSVSLIRVDGVW